MHLRFSKGDAIYLREDNGDTLWIFGRYGSLFFCKGALIGIVFLTSCGGKARVML